jgi:hypothetical protein
MFEFDFADWANALDGDEDYFIWWSSNCFEDIDWAESLQPEDVERIVSNIKELADELWQNVNEAGVEIQKALSEFFSGIAKFLKEQGTKINQSVLEFFETLSKDISTYRNDVAKDNASLDPKNMQTSPDKDSSKTGEGKTYVERLMQESQNTSGKTR